MHYFLVYVSSASRLFSRADLDEILAWSHVHNAEIGVTGALLYKDGNVMQVLEGEKSAVRALYTQIERDPRHKGVTTILQGQQAERQFADWSMAFQDLASPVAVSTPGYSDFLNVRLTKEEFAAHPTMCQRLLTSFRKTM